MTDTWSDLITTAEAAEILRISPKTLANQRYRGEGMPYIQLPGGLIRYSRHTIAAEIAAGTVAPQNRIA